ncbi:MAG TPA: helix-turn-helix domain-containing protein [Candidatus Limiplasma sp.]|nr:helix-turn-helix domain-containing protein [Candidatus Limiplasma sp.]
MREIPTRQRIIHEGLILFAKRGYAAVSVEQIAAAVGIKAPSLYKHFAGKQAIFQAIIDEMQARHRQKMQAVQMQGIDADQDVAFFLHIDEERLIEIGRSLFLYYLHDEYFSNFRRVLTMGQYADPQLAELLTRQCMTDPLRYNEQLFAMMMGAGFFVPAAPRVMALHFYAPIYMLLLICDAHPEREADSLRTLEDHIRQFNRMYVTEKRKNL